jgi:AAA domain
MGQPSADGTMIVEFLGLPGAGKSTLSQLAAEVLADCGIAVECPNRTLARGAGPTRRWLRKLGCVIDGLARAPYYSGSAIKLVNKTRQKSLRELLSTTFNWLLVTALVRRAAGSPKVVLLDQGIAQALWSIGFSAQSEAWQDIMRRAASLAPTPDMIVLIHAAPPNIAGRLAVRPRNSSRLTATQAADPELLARASALLESATAIMQCRQVPITTVSNEHHRQLADNAATIVREITMTLSKEQQPDARV